MVPHDAVISYLDGRDRAEGRVAADMLRVESRRPRAVNLRAQLSHADAAALDGHHVEPQNLLARAQDARAALTPGADDRVCDADAAAGVDGPHTPDWL